MNFSKHFATTGILTALFVTATCLAKDEKAITGVITDYGIYEPIAAVKIEAAPETTSGITRVPGEIRFTEHTNGIPAKLGINFGFRYTAEGFTGVKKVAITKVVTHPPVKKPDGITSTGFRTTLTKPVVGGKISGFTGYSFDHEYELVPGPWKIECWYQDQKLVEKTFYVLDAKKK